MGGGGGGGAVATGAPSRQSSTVVVGDHHKGGRPPVKDDDTDMSTDASISSSHSHGAGFALSAIRHTVVRCITTSAQGFVRQSGATLRPLLQQGSDRMLKPRQRALSTPPTPLTANQQARRKRRRDNYFKLMRMIYRIDKDPFVASRVILAWAAICLLLRAGDLLLAATMSFLSVLILHQTTQLASTRPLEGWYYVGMASLVVSVGSWLISTYLLRNDNIVSLSLWERLNDQLWFWGRGIPRIWAIVIAGLLYRDISTSKDGDDNAIETIEVEVAILRMKPPPIAKIYQRHVRPLQIGIQKGPIVIGTISTKELRGDSTTVPPTDGSNRFMTTAFSHHIESTKGSFIGIHIKDRNTLQGRTYIAAPGVHCMKVSNWFKCADMELLIEIQTRPLATPFLFRASTLLPTIGCMALAAAFWK